MSSAPRILFAHGAGAGSSSSWMRAWTARLSALGPVVAFDYPYMAAGKKLPDRLPALVEAHRQAIRALRESSGASVLLAGKSMGSRVSCHVANEEGVLGVVCFGYPLVGAGKRQAIRSEVLRDLEKPVLFVQGTRDTMCPLDQLAAVRATMKTRSELFEVVGGDHSLELSAASRKARGVTQEESDDAVMAAVRAFAASLALRFSRRLWPDGSRSSASARSWGRSSGTRAGCASPA